MKRWAFLFFAVAALAAPWPSHAAGTKVLRYAMVTDATTLDSGALQDIYSQEVAGSIFEPLYRYDYLARPVRIRPLLAAAMPEVSADQREYTVHLRAGVFYADDPAFDGKPREVMAEDVVYALKRVFDPRCKSPQYPTFSGLGISGLDAVRQQALERKQPFDYAQPVAGLQALDAHTLRFKLDRPNPRFIYELTNGVVSAPVAHEVTERYGDAIGEHPVGTGPFRLAGWRHGSRIELERNPGYRELHYDEQPAPGDAAGQAIAAKLHGRRLPMVDRVEIAIIEEDQPRWLAFLHHEIDLHNVAPTYAPVAYPHGRLAPKLARQGITAQPMARSDVVFTFFNMDDPVVGGYAPAQVALRRAIGLAYDNAEEIRNVRRGMGVAPQSVLPPTAYGHDPRLKSEMSEFDLPRAKALLDLYGFVDHDGDGWRDRPDGSPLLLQYHTDRSQSLKPFNELWERHMRALGLRIEFVPGTWTEQAKAARAGKLMMWALSWNAGAPDADEFLRLAYGGAVGGDNMSRFQLAAFDQLYDRQSALPDGPERLAAIAEMNRLMLAYLPIKAHVHRMQVSLSWPRVVGFRPHPFMLGFHAFVDLEDPR